MKKIITTIFTLITAFTIFTSCSGKGETSPSSSSEIESGDVLSLELRESGKVAVKYSPTNAAKLPRIADIYLKYDKTALKLKNFEKGSAIGDADKDLFVKSDETNGLIRVTSLSAANLNRIADGDIAVLEFEKISNSDTTLEFDKNRQVFAPAEANDQVTFGSSLTL